jgi:hypothetical protein
LLDHPAFDDFIAHQGEHLAVQEDRPRIAVPVCARGLAPVFLAHPRQCHQGAYFHQMQLIVVQLQHASRFIPKPAQAALGSISDWQSDQAIAGLVGLVEEAVAARIGLRRGRTGRVAASVNAS